MKIITLSRQSTSHASRLILCFSGWGIHGNIFDNITMPGYDVMAVWDYRDMSTPCLDTLTCYEEVIVMAWSFGVHAAARFMDSNPPLNITARIAVNGTRFTADDTRGIPRNIFSATLDGLCERSIAKFDMRMCGGATAYKEFANRNLSRIVSDLRDELKTFDTSEAPLMLWDKAFISRRDLIIPPENQKRAWTDETVEIIEIDGPHLPDFNTILHRSLTDKALVTRRFGKAVSTYDTNAIIQREVAEKLLDMTMSLTGTRHDNVLEIGCGTGILTDRLLQRIYPKSLTLHDLHISSDITEMRHRYPEVNISIKECDAESEIIRETDSSYDLVISASTVQWFNSLRKYLPELSRVLAPGGIAAISTYGPDTMREVHESAGTSNRFHSLEKIVKMLPASLEIMSIQEERLTARYHSPLDVLRHISRTGVNGIESEGAHVFRMLHNYPTDPDGNVPLTYHPIYIILKKHE